MQRNRNFKICVFMVTGILILASFCLYYRYNAATYLKFVSDGELFSKCGGDVLISIDYDGYVWDITHKPYWIDVVKRKDDYFLIECKPNTTGVDRKDHITVKSGKAVCSLPIFQFGETQILNISKRSIEMTKSGGTEHIDVVSDGTGYNVELPDFCSIKNKDKTGFTIHIPTNTDYSRKGTIIVKEDRQRVAISITQEGKCRRCKGEGIIPCNICNGRKHTWTFFGYSTQCYFCDEDGMISCPDCMGTGTR